jgi:hypothetical protein
MRNLKLKAKKMKMKKKKKTEVYFNKSLTDLFLLFPNTNIILYS